MPTRSPHRAGRAQLRHPVPLVKVSLYSCRVHPFPLSVVVAFTCLSDSCASLRFLSISLSCFSPTVLLPGVALPLWFHQLHRSGSLRSRFPWLRYYDCARTSGSTTAHRPSRSLLSYTSGTEYLLLFRVTIHLYDARPLSPRSREKPGALISRFIRQRYLSFRGVEPSHVPV